MCGGGGGVHARVRTLLRWVKRSGKRMRSSLGALTTLVRNGLTQPRFVGPAAAVGIVGCSSDLASAIGR